MFRHTYVRPHVRTISHVHINVCVCTVCICLCMCVCVLRIHTNVFAHTHARTHTTTFDASLSKQIYLGNSFTYHLIPCIVPSCPDTASHLYNFTSAQEHGCKKRSWQRETIPCTTCFGSCGLDSQLSGINQLTTKYQCVSVQKSTHKWEWEWEQTHSK